MSLEGWEDSHLSFLIGSLDDEGRLLTVVKQSDCVWIRETLGDEAGDAAEMGPIEIDRNAVKEFVSYAVAERRWILDYTAIV